MDTVTAVTDDTKCVKDSRSEAMAGPAGRDGCSFTRDTSAHVDALCRTAGGRGGKVWVQTTRTTSECLSK